MFCQNCGHTVTSEAVFCGNCGQPLSVLAPAPDNKRRGLAALMVYLLLVVIALTAGWFWYQSREPAEAERPSIAQTISLQTVPAKAMTVPPTPFSIQSTSTTIPPTTPAPTLIPSVTPQPSKTSEPTGIPTTVPTDTPTATTAPTIAPTEVVGNSVRELFLTEPRLQGEDVRVVQARLLAIGYSKVGAVDGIFGPLTEGAVVAFQQDNDLEMDGIVGPLTWSALFDDEVGYEVIGRSVQGKPLEAVRFGQGDNAMIFIGGLHAGYSPGTVALAQQAISYFSQNLDRVPMAVSLYIIPTVNPDSLVTPGEYNGRLNANRVDLNRNWDCNWTQDTRWGNQLVPGSGGSAPFSEPEVSSLRDFILLEASTAVIFWQARAINGLSSPGGCQSGSQVSQSLATLYGRAAGYQVADFEELTNQQINGDGTNWLDAQGIPATAILLPEYTAMDWENNLAGMMAVIEQFRE